MFLVSTYLERLKLEVIIFYNAHLALRTRYSQQIKLGQLLHLATIMWREYQVLSMQFPNCTRGTVTDCTRKHWNLISFQYASYLIRTPWRVYTPECTSYSVEAIFRRIAKTSSCDVVGSWWVFDSRNPSYSMETRKRSELATEVVNCPKGFCGST